MSPFHLHLRLWCRGSASAPRLDGSAIHVEQCGDARRTGATTGRGRGGRAAKTACRGRASARARKQYHRVGIVPPLHPYDDIETVAVTGFGLLDLGHGYFAEAEPVILDLREAIASRRRAAERELPRAAEGHFVIDPRR